MDQWVVEERKRKEIYRFFLQWKYQWFASMNMSNKKNHSDAQTHLWEWREMFHREKIEIAYNGLYLSVPHHHVHLLMICYHKMGRPLSYVDEAKWEKEWARIAKHKAVIKRINDSEAVTEYVALKNTVPGKYELLKSHNDKILKRYKLK